MDATAEPGGRRERKKQLTRWAISNVATELFMERGFDAVTVAEVAAAADVAVQTVFNHFPTKEDLVFDETGWWAGPAEAIREAPAGVDVIEALRLRYLAQIRNQLAVGHLATWRQFNSTIESSPALLARRRRIAEEMEVLLAEALQERDGRLSDRMARLIAAQYAAAQKVLEGELARFVPVDPSPEQLEEAVAGLEQAIDEVFAVLARGFELAARSKH
ncbi:TetR family transcriptional regulator [Kribbella qitaiheensis]|uniref:TetR family transcriptional regulator n=1 Tax=Kribbella qitaiheensis TaxID=1544730 RepID=A0A7G6X4C8_9ACTN|nr:TetR family transcriptional regulator [Kribbella qitaiheensis]QNE21093.1 TetR family transcriptional regulator [Kribbella qitaiheensis]